MKLASYYKSYGNSVRLVRGIDKNLDFHPDIIEVTSLFTYAWKQVHKAINHYHKECPDAKINVGGIYASLLPEHIKSTFPFVNIQVGLHDEAEDYMPSYDILKDVPKWQDWDSSILFSSRGCIRKCPFCAVPKMEGKFRSVIQNVKRYIHPKHKKVIFWDNNFFASPYWKEIITELKDMGLKVDFNQGLDARLIDEEKASMISELKMDSIRMGYDIPEEKEAITKATNLLHDYGINKRKIMFYNLYNFYDENTSKGDTPESFLDRVQYVLDLGCVSYPMRFEPLTSLKKNDYVSPLWDQTKLELVAKSRRVMGSGGVFPPYEGLINKFKEARSFEEAFGLRPIEQGKNKTSSMRRNEK
jgi:hypothetical protein